MSPFAELLATAPGGFLTLIICELAVFENINNSLQGELAAPDIGGHADMATAAWCSLAPEPSLGPVTREGSGRAQEQLAWLQVWSGCQGPGPPSLSGRLHLPSQAHPSCDQLPEEANPMPAPKPDE